MPRSASHAAISGIIREQVPATLDLLRQMVEINSWTANPEGVNRVGQLTAGAFAGLGFAADFVPSATVHPETTRLCGNHLLLTREGNSNKKIVFVSHLDTVFSPEEEAANRFVWRHDVHPKYGPIIYGPGTIDIKGGTAMMWLVLKGLQTALPEVFEAITWQLFLDSSEEVLADDFPSVWSRHITRENTLAGLVFEAETRRPLAPGADHAGRSRLVVARKGRAEWKITVAGRGAHPGVDHPCGANAIVQLSRVVDRIAAMTDYSKNLTFNVGTIRGGTAMNRVPSEAVATGEVRAFSPEILEEAVAALRALGGKGDVSSPKDGWTCSISVEVANKAPPWPPNESIRLFDVWKRMGDQIDYPVEPESRGGISDGNVLSQVVPTIDGLGPWGMNDHCSEQTEDRSKEQEFVSPGSFLPKAMLNVLAIADLLESYRQE